MENPVHHDQPSTSGNPDESASGMKVTEYERIAVGGLLNTIADELKKAEKDVRGLFEIVENVPAEQMAGTLDAKLVVLSAISQSTPINQLPGEWINIALSKIRGETDKSAMRSLNSVLKIILNKLVPYDISIPPPTRVQNEGAPAETSAASSSTAATGRSANRNRAVG